MADRKTKKAPRMGARKSTRSSPTTGSYFLSLELENVRCFAEKQTLDLSDGNGRPARWTILLGENGTGKTTILQMLAGFEEIHGGSPTGKTRKPLRYLYEPFSRIQTILRDPGYPQASSRAHFIDNYRLDSHSARPDRSIEFNVMNYLITIPPFMDDERTPICYGYGAGRRLNNAAIDRSIMGSGTESLFLDDAKLINAEEWLLLLDYSASKVSEVQEHQKRRLEMVKEVLINILPGVMEIRFDPSSGVMPTPRVEFKTYYGWVPLRQLGYGYQTMVAWVVDFAARMIERYPDNVNPLAEPAVVLVDEIDLHLHPKWQREVIGFLTERFPNTQFIVTAHSPLIVQSAAGAKLAVLKREGDHVVIENHPETIRGWRIDQVLTSDLFDLPTARPPAEEKLLLRRKEMLTKPRLTKADRDELKNIEDKLGPIPTGESFEEAKTLALIKESIEFLKKTQGPKS